MTARGTRSSPAFPREAIAEERRKWVGMSSSEIARELIAAFHLSISVEDMLREKRKSFRDMVEKGLDPFPGLTEELANWADAELAVATSGSRREALLVLEKLRLPVHWKAVVTCDDVPRAKPTSGLLPARRGAAGEEPGPVHCNRRFHQRDACGSCGGNQGARRDHRVTWDPCPPAWRGRSLPPLARWSGCAVSCSPRRKGARMAARQKDRTHTLRPAPHLPRDACSRSAFQRSCRWPRA